jgi:uncharacterized membrane protein YhiD involved in acid resistance
VHRLIVQVPWGDLGAGVIIWNGVNLRGITAAATIWRAAAVGALASATVTCLRRPSGLRRFDRAW